MGGRHLDGGCGRQCPGCTSESFQRGCDEERRRVVALITVALDEWRDVERKTSDRDAMGAINAPEELLASISQEPAK